MLDRSCWADHDGQVMMDRSCWAGHAGQVVLGRSCWTRSRVLPTDERPGLGGPVVRLPPAQLGRVRDGGGGGGIPAVPRYSRASDGHG